MRHLWLAVCVALVPGLSRAEDRALILANERYQNAGPVGAADEALDAVRPLEGLGFRVVSGADVGAAGARQRLSQFMSGMQEAGRLVIVLAGHFARSGQGTWFLGVDANAPDLAQVDAAGLPLSTVLEIAAAAPGGAVVLLGTEERRLPLGEGLAPGIGPLAIPQGVTVIRGEARAVAAFAARDLARRGESLAALAAGRAGVVAEGFVAPLVPFLPPAGANDPVVPPFPGPSPEETALYEAARTLGTIEAYETYLARFPNGTFAAEARAAIERLRAEPVNRAQAAEEALALTRDQRRQIQRDLALLGYDPRGIDGIFGPATRTALRAWQQATGFAVTGYLDAPQLDRLRAQARDRAIQLEEEARARQLEEERRDRAYWQETGAAGSEAGLRAYLERYPDGLFADVARTRLAAIEDERRRQAAAADRAAWDSARDADTVAAYRRYLQDFPQGAFVAAARARIAEIEADLRDSDRVDAARQAEAALGLTPFTRRLIEQRLDALGLQPGAVDGTFDEQSRRAIRRFQRARGLPVTGYVDEATLIRLLADAIRGGN
ncbi:MAG: peptidoglycan-binding protein [Rhodobacteraceae bacterium]|jgi:peptidoglycan hydrolase-like protein with peptidoglycan-binding domain|nr:peptidoglycan-binding protein [Paracoccaceae bacterium]